MPCALLLRIASEYECYSFTLAFKHETRMAQKSPGMTEARALRPLPAFIFASRWLQLPLYLGLIVAQAIYVWLFWQELYYLVMATFGDAERADATSSTRSRSKAAPATHEAQRDRAHAGGARA